MSILVITTGGTIGAMPYADPKSPPDYSEMPPPGVDFVCEALKNEFALAKSRCISFEQRDSKLMDNAYRQALLKTVTDAEEKKVLITHGTDALLQTAEFLFRHCAALDDKVLVMTGSMIPLTNGPESDGYRNLKFSMEQLKHLATDANGSNIYIVLCDYEKHDDSNSPWQPKLYRYYPDRYEKTYADDKRFSRLRRIAN